jgi:hypothetical protein
MGSALTCRGRFSVRHRDGDGLLALLRAGGAVVEEHGHQGHGRRRQDFELIEIVVYRRDLDCQGLRVLEVDAELVDL